MIIVEKKGKEIYIKISNVHLALFEQNKNVQMYKYLYILFTAFLSKSVVKSQHGRRRGLEEEVGEVATQGMEGERGRKGGIEREKARRREGGAQRGATL